MSKNTTDAEKQTDETQEKYVVTPIEMAEIVKACLEQTIAGQGHRKDWLPNVLNSIEGINGIYSGKKVKLRKLSRLSEEKNSNE